MKHIFSVEVNYADNSIKPIEVDIFKCICIKHSYDTYSQLSASITKCDFIEGNTYYYGMYGRYQVDHKYAVIESGNNHRYFTEEEFNTHFIDSLKNRETKITSIVD